MSDKPMSQSRRNAVKLMLGGAVAVPFVNLVGVSGAHAADLPHVDAKADPTAIALKYVEDATIDGVLWRTNWSDNAISYSDPNATTDYQAGYTTGYPNFFMAVSMVLMSAPSSMSRVTSRMASTAFAGSLW